MPGYSKITGQSPPVCLVIVVVVIVVAVAAVVTFASFASAIPVMVVVNPSAVSTPIANVILAAFVARADPRGAFIGRPSPIAFMPSVAPAFRIPIPVYPIVIRTRGVWTYANHPGTRRLTNPDSHGYLSVDCRRSGQKRCSKQRGKDKFFHVRFPLLGWNTCRDNFSSRDDAQKGTGVEVLEVHPAYATGQGLSTDKGPMCLVGTPWK